MSNSIKRIMIIDALGAGVSGDMMVGALLDLGASTTKVIEAMQTAGDYLKGCRGLQVIVSDVRRRGFRAKKVDIQADEYIPQRTRDDLRDSAVESLTNLAISDRAKQFVLDCVDALITAESKVHGETKEGCHLHELASVDTLADIIGSAVALDDLALFAGTKIYSTAIAVGGGLFRFSHGRVSCPAPATLELLRSKCAPMVGGSVEVELATPTGVALLTNIVHEFIHCYPLIKPIAVGYGAGTKDFSEMPNVLRIVLGEPCDYGLMSDEVYVLETNLDDVSGEVIGHTVDRLLCEGARDVSVIPLFTKKNRPGQIIKVITDSTSLEHLCRVLMDETGTIGVRFYPCERRILARESISIEVVICDTKASVPVKVARDRQGKVIQIKPEYDEVRTLANSTGMPLRDIIDLVTKRARELLMAEKNDENLE